MDCSTKSGWATSCTKTEPGGDLKKDNPSCVDYEADMLLTTLQREGYGWNDGSPDLFFVNFKISDVVGYQSSWIHRRWASASRAGFRARPDHRSTEQHGRGLRRYPDDRSRTHPFTGKDCAWPLSADEIAADVDATSECRRERIWW